MCNFWSTFLSLVMLHIEKSLLLLRCPKWPQCWSAQNCKYEERGRTWSASTYCYRMCQGTVTALVSSLHRYPTALSLVLNRKVSWETVTKIKSWLILGGTGGNQKTTSIFLTGVFSREPHFLGWRKNLPIENWARQSHDMPKVKDSGRKF